MALTDKLNGLGGIPFQQLTAQVTETYRCIGHDHGPAILAAKPPKKFADHIADIAREMWETHQTITSDPVLIHTYGQRLAEGVYKGYGADPLDIDWNSTDYNVITQLENNVWQFSAAKTHTQLRDMAKALIGEDGKIRSWNEFKREVGAISGKQLAWLRTEYDSAIGGAQMAAKWQQIQAQKDHFPFLQFDAILDGKTTKICSSLDGVIRPVDDPFWQTYYPPNHYLCRSTVRQLAEGIVTPDEDIIYPEKMPDMFKVNLGERSLIFPTDHPYYTDIPAHVINNATLYMPEDRQYLIRHKAADGTIMRVHRKTELENREDFPDLLRMGIFDADKGFTVDILPVIHEKEEALRAKLLQGTKGNKNPDLRRFGGYWEVEKPREPITAKRIKNRIAEGASQANKVVILLDEPYDPVMLRQIARERFERVEGLLEVTFVTRDGEYYEFRKNDQGR